MDFFLTFYFTLVALLQLKCTLSLFQETQKSLETFLQEGQVSNNPAAFCHGLADIHKSQEIIVYISNQFFFVKKI